MSSINYKEKDSAEILGRAAGVIAGMFVIGMLALAAVTIFAVKFGENIMNYRS